jgi:DNA polymerase V
MKAIFDCNSFYCSCERVFRPELSEAPVVVLSNNDGCIISRTDEAKSLGVGMAGPYFLARPLIEQHGVEVFSSNYNLYGDMSRRVMQTLEYLFGEENVEVYSVDECFVDMKGFTEEQLYTVALKAKKTVEQWTGIKVSVGVAATKTLSKLANAMAKRNKKETKGVVVLGSENEILEALQKTPVKTIWGVGRQHADKLTCFNVHTALDIYRMPEEWVRRNLGGVVGVRLWKELRGEEAIIMNESLTTKKMIATTRMFGNPVDALADIKEAVATYTARAAEKLRRQKCAATVISTFVVPKENNIEGNKFRHGATLSTRTVLLQPTSFTNELIKPAVRMAECLFSQGQSYKKAGVILSGLVPEDAIQANLFEGTKPIGRFLMDMVDNINFGMRGDVVKFASSGTKRDWKMRREFHSPRYTTRWDELCEVK